MRAALRALVAGLAAASLAAPALAQEWRPERIAPGVYAFIGAVEAPAPANAGRVGNAGFIVGPRGVVAVDSGISWRQGQAMLAAIARMTPQPVRAVILTQARQEFIFGAAAFRERGIPVLAHRRAAELIEARCAVCLRQLTELLGAQAMRGSEVVVPEWQIERSLTLTATGRRIELIAFDHASSPGDLAVFDAQSGVLFAGGLVHRARVPELRDARLDGWLEALREIGRLPVRRVVPGFGRIAGPQALAEAGAYLDALRAAVAERYQRGEGLVEAMQTAQLPAYRHWTDYTERHPLNVQHVWLGLEREEFR